MNNLTTYRTLKDLDMQTILEEIARQIPNGEYLRDYNCASTGELRIIVKQQGWETRYVAKDYGGVIKLIHKP